MTQFIRFAQIGGLASLCHVAVASLLVLLGGNAYWANLAAFLIAFWISFLGHVRFTFPGAGIELPVTMRRFVLTAITGLILNQSILALILNTTSASAYIALMLSTGITALSTFWLCKLWAFRGPPR